MDFYYSDFLPQLASLLSLHAEFKDTATIQNISAVRPRRKGETPACAGVVTHVLFYMPQIKTMLSKGQRSVKIHRDCTCH